MPEEGLSNAGADRAPALSWCSISSIYPGHPGFFAYISGAGTVPGAAADLIASALNQNLGGFRLSPGANQVEAALVSWLARHASACREEAGGQVVAGGAMANFVGLKVARDRVLGPEGRARGVAGGPPLAFYASGESHVVQRRARRHARASGLRRSSGQSRWTASSDAKRRRARRCARARPCRGCVVPPAAVIATAGTTSTGAIDPLDEIGGSLRAAYTPTWFHVDACYGGPAVLAKDLRPLLAGVERAGSIAVDAHKWLYTPLLGGCVLVREAALLPASFAADASFIWLDEATLEIQGK